MPSLPTRSNFFLKKSVGWGEGEGEDVSVSEESRRGYQNSWSCEPYDVRARDQTWVLCKSNKLNYWSPHLPFKNINRKTSLYIVFSCVGKVLVHVLLWVPRLDEDSNRHKQYMTNMRLTSCRREKLSSTITWKVIFETHCGRYVVHECGQCCEVNQTWLFVKIQQRARHGSTHF